MSIAKKILLLSNLNSVHTKKWARSLADAGFRVQVVGLSPLVFSSDYYNHSLISLHSLSRGGHSKFKFLFGILNFYKLIKELKPDLVHAHFATSYGLLGAFVKRTPLFLTFWGDDILIFPFKSFLHRKILEFNLRHADRLYSASNIMKTVAAQLTSKNVMVIPFGVDIEKFKPQVSKATDAIVIGTVKGLEDIYGIDYLIKSFAELRKRIKNPVRLLIVGEGSKENELKKLAQDLNLDEDVIEFRGRVDHLLIPETLHEMDIFVALSRSESFGVAVVEAQACGKPVIVSDVGGLPEVVKDKETGLIVPVGNIQAAAEALETLIHDRELRSAMGKKGRERVLEKFDCNKNVQAMIAEYVAVLPS